VSFDPALENSIRLLISARTGQPVELDKNISADVILLGGMFPAAC
jgi:hypothetical protein